MKQWDMQRLTIYAAGCGVVLLTLLPALVIAWVTVPGPQQGTVSVAVFYGYILGCLAAAGNFAIRGVSKQMKDSKI